MFKELKNDKTLEGPDKKKETWGVGDHNNCKQLKSGELVLKQQKVRVVEQTAQLLGSQIDVFFKWINLSVFFLAINDN